MTGWTPLMSRIAAGKAIGLIFGVLGFWGVVWFAPDVDVLMRWGTLLWYVTVGAIIGVYGVVNWHPVLSLPLPWWFRAPIIGAWLNFVLALFLYSSLAPLLTDAGFWSGPVGFLTASALEGAFVGWVIGGVTTRLCGDGPETATLQQT